MGAGHGSQSSLGRSADAGRAWPAVASRTSAGAGTTGPGAPAAFTPEFDDVTFTEQSIVFDEAAMRSGLRGVSGTTYRLAAATPGADRLAAGRVALFGGKAVRKVTSVATKGDEVVVETADATLDQLISNGSIGWSAPVNWGALPRESYRQAVLDHGLTGSIVNATWARDDDVALNFAGRLEGFDVAFKLKPKADKLEFELEAKRANVGITAKGSISNFVQQARVTYDHGKGTLVRADLLGLKGDAEITWAAVGHGSPGLDTDVVRISLPFEAPIPFVVGGIPFTLKVKSAIRIVPVMRKDSSSGGSFKVTYDSDQGFTTEVGKPGGSAKVRSADGQLGSKETVTAGYVPVGFAWGWEFPRFELAVLGIGTFAAVSFDTYVAGEFTPGTTLTADIPPCQRASVELKAIALFKLEALGFVKISNQRTLWTKKVEKFKDNKPCTLTGR